MQKPLNLTSLSSIKLKSLCEGGPAVNRGIYISASGMLQEAQRLDIIANNLANANTTGFKRDTVVSSPFHDMLVERLGDPGPASPAPVGPLGLGAFNAMSGTRLRDGTLRYTGRDLDLALTGNALFTVRTPYGVAYTRSGSFMQDGNGRLVTADGYAVLVDGAEVGGPGVKITINDQGEVFADERLVGKLSIVTTDQLGPVRKLGNNLYSTDGQGSQVMSEPRDPDDPRGQYQLRVGFLETSTVEPVIEMVLLITTMRAFESNQKAMTIQDEATAKAVNEVGRI